MLEKVKDSLLNVITKPVGLGLSVSPDGKQIVYAQADHQDSDLVLVDQIEGPHNSFDGWSGDTRYARNGIWVWDRRRVTRYSEVILSACCSVDVM
jgi:hypothetical protein